MICVIVSGGCHDIVIVSCIVRKRLVRDRLVLDDPDVLH